MRLPSHLGRGAALAASLATPALGISTRQEHTSDLSLPHRVVAQFTVPTWLENIAVRSNGNILSTQLIPNASLISITDPASSSPVVSLVEAFDASTLSGLLGITEAKPDIFAFVGAWWPDPSTALNGNFSIWTADFRSSESAEIKKIADIEGASLLNGIAAVPGCGGSVLVGDAFAGHILHLNLRTGAYDVVLSVPETATNGSDATSIGVNGIKIHDGYVYWAQSWRATIYRAALDLATGYLVSNASIEVVAQLDANFIDDFAIDGNGIIWAATNRDNSLFAVSTVDGKSVEVTGAAGETTLTSDTSAAFGRGKGDAKVLYVATAGNSTEGGKVVAIDTTGFAS